MILSLFSIQEVHAADVQHNWGWGHDQAADATYTSYPHKGVMFSGNDIIGHVKANGDSMSDYDPVVRFRVNVSMGTAYGNIPVALFYRNCTAAGAGGTACDAVNPIWTQVGSQDATGVPFRFNESTLITNGTQIQYRSADVPSSLRLITEHLSVQVAGCNVEGGIGISDATCNIASASYTEFDFSFKYIGSAPASSQLYEFLVAVYTGGQWVRAGYSGMHNNQGALLYVDPANVFSAMYGPASLVSSAWTNGANGYSSDNVDATTATNGATVVYGYGASGLGIPAGSVIQRVMIGGEYYTAQDDTIKLEITWNGGTNWSTATAPAYIISTSGASCTWTNCAIIAAAGEEYSQYVDVTGATAWTAALLNSGNLQVRVTYSQTGGASGPNYLDWVPIMVTFSNNSPNTPTLNSPASGATQVSQTPQLKTTATDPEGNLVQYKIELATDSAFTTGLQTFDQTQSATGWSGMDAGSAYNSGTQATYTVQTALPICTDYWWRSYAVDASLLSFGQHWSSTQGTPNSFRTTCFEITTASLPTGYQWLSYTDTTLSASGGVPPYANWTVVFGALPAGLTLNSATGLISGTPTSFGTFNITVQVSDSIPQTTTKALTITINELTGITITDISGTPVSPTITAGNTFQFKAKGTYSDLSQFDVSAITPLEWKSSNTAVATVGLNTGLANGIGAGSATICAVTAGEACP